MSDEATAPETGPAAGAPEQAPCTTCDGWGEVECSYCEGGGYGDDDNCPECGGDGYITCPTCDGRKVERTVAQRAGSAAVSPEDKS
ncbi:MAG: hypothetical protein AB7O65_08105 [Candidatus Korobacteraceae bacterium]